MSYYVLKGCRCAYGLFLSSYSPFYTFTSVLTMPSQCCTGCAHHLPLTSFLKDTLTDPTDPTARVYRLCLPCRTTATNSKKRRAALQALDPNIQPPKRVRRPRTRPQAVPLCPYLLYSLLMDYRTLCQTRSLLFNLLPARQMSSLRLLPPFRPRTSLSDSSRPANGSI